MAHEALRRAIEVGGGQSSLAKKIGVRQSTLWHWLERSKRGVPAEYCVAVETATGISRHELRPDVYQSEEGEVA